MADKEKKKPEYFKNKISFLDNYQAFFIIIEGLSFSENEK